MAKEQSALSGKVPVVYASLFLNITVISKSLQILLVQIRNTLYLYMDFLYRRNRGSDWDG